MKGRTALSWSFGDETGWMIGAGVFCVTALGIGWVVAEIAHRWRSIGSLDLDGPISRRPSVVLGALVGLAIFASFYFSALSGFMQLDYRQGQLTMRHIMPARTVILPLIEVINVQEVPDYKGRWRLVLTTDMSGSYESAQASRTDVGQAAAWLRREMRKLSSTPR